MFEFEYEFTSARLSSWDASVLQLAGIWSPSTGGKKKSKTKGTTHSFTLLTNILSLSLSLGGYQSLNPFYDERITLPPSDFLLEDTFDPDIAGLQSRDENLTDEQRLRMDGEEKEGLSAVERRDKESDRLSSAAVSRRSYRSMVQSYAEKKPAEPPVIWDPVVKEAERQRRTLHSAGDRLLDEYEVCNVCTIVHDTDHVCTIVHDTDHVCTIVHDTDHVCTIVHDTDHVCTIVHDTDHVCTIVHDTDHVCTIVHHTDHVCTIVHDTDHVCTIVHDTDHVCTIVHDTDHVCTIVHHTDHVCTIVHHTDILIMYALF